MKPLSVLLVVVAGLGLIAGCGGSGSTATPIAPVATVPPATGRPATTVPAGIGPAPTARSQPTPAAQRSQLAAAEQALNDAQAALGASDPAVDGSDVSKAKAQEGSAP